MKIRNVGKKLVVKFLGDLLAPLIVAYLFDLERDELDFRFVEDHLLLLSEVTWVCYLNDYAGLSTVEPKRGQKEQQTALIHCIFSDSLIAIPMSVSTFGL